MSLKIPQEEVIMSQDELLNNYENEKEQTEIQAEARLRGSGTKVSGIARNHVTSGEVSQEIQLNREKSNRNIEKIMELIGSERLIFFSDAVIAISLTLLILPLLTAVQGATDYALTATEFLSENKDLFLAFALSFLVVNLYWRAHDRLFHYVRKYSEGIRRLNNFFLFFIVLLPVNTSISQQLDTEEGSVLAHVLYVSNLLLIDIILLVMNVLVRKDPRMWNPNHEPPTSLGLLILLAGLIILAMTMVVVCLVPNPAVLNILFSLVLLNPLVYILHRRGNTVDHFGKMIDYCIGK
mmetsp:Transcript_19967/g.28407  ORF Transcript_19967/g.28407 Transcript_19967/m.28407 type:complete len:295 (-) Transcript_19967:176-1060(-)